MLLIVIHSKDLPDEVFGGKPRPVKKKQKKRKSAPAQETPVPDAVKRLKSDDPDTPLAESSELIPEYEVEKQEKSEQ